MFVLLSSLLLKRKLSVPDLKPLSEMDAKIVFDSLSRYLIIGIYQPQPLVNTSCLFVFCAAAFARGGTKGDEPHISAARAATGSAGKWVIYMPAEQPGSNLHACRSAFQP